MIKLKSLMTENEDCPRCNGWKTIFIRAGIPNITAPCPKCNLGYPDKMITIYRGESVYNKNGNYYTTDKEWARQFTQSGQDKEIQQKSIKLSSIYKPTPLPQATDDAQVNQAIKDAKTGKFDAVWMDEGPNEPNSIFVINKKSLMKELEYPLAGKEDLQSYGGMAGWKGKIVWMSPDKFLGLAHPLSMSAMNKKSYANIEHRMKNGLPLDFLVLQVDVDKKKVVGHEGRHRAIAAKMNGVEKVPVLIFTGSSFKRVPQWGPEDHAMADAAEFKPEWQKLQENIVAIKRKKNGDCFNNAREYANENESLNPIIVHGKVRSNKGNTIDHAWVEIANGQVIVDPTVGVQTDKNTYYTNTNAIPISKYTPHQANINMIRSGHHGPWLDTETNGRHLQEKRIKLKEILSIANNAEFKRWFGNSKVVDERGNPLVVYHGTKSRFKSFDLKKFGATDQGLVGKGFYFTSSGHEAGEHSLNVQYGSGENPNVMPCYVSLQNPFVITRGVLPDGRTWRDVHPNGINSPEGGAALNKEIKDKGYDGVMFVSNTGVIRHVVAFYPEQIKSAIGNTGTFSPDDPDITRENTTEEKEEIFKLGGDPNNESPKMPVNWDEPDVQITGKWTPNEIKKFIPLPNDYQAIYRAIIDVSDLDPKFAEEEEEFGDYGYEWSDFRRIKRGFPPIVVRRFPNKRLVILDGNHRVKWAQDVGYRTIAAWVVDDLIQKYIDDNKETKKIKLNELSLMTEATKDEAALDFLKKMVRSGPFKGNVYLAGGAVRDMIRGEIPKDLDVVVTNHDRKGGLDFAVWLAKQMGNYKGPTTPPPKFPSNIKIDANGRPDYRPDTDLSPEEIAIYRTAEMERAAQEYDSYYGLFSNPVVFPKFGTAKVVLKGEHNGVSLDGFDVEAVFARKEVYTPGSRKPEVFPGTIEDDAFRRDFTVNSMMMDLSTDKILDITGKGKTDIESGTIRTTSDPDEIFGQDALRMFRAIRFATKYNWEIDPATLAGIKTNLNNLGNTSKERIRDELDKILKTGNPRKGLELLRDTGLLPYIAPELQKAVGMIQNVHHKEDVFGHTLSVLQGTRPDLVTRLMALFHDIGKVATRSETPTGVHFYGHEDAGAEIAEKIMRDLKYPSELINAVKLGIRVHMRLKSGGDSGVKLSDKSLRKFKIEVGDQLEKILDLIHADNVSHADASSMPNQIEQIRKRIDALDIQVKKPTLPIDGDDLIALGVPRGPMFSTILSAVSDAWFENPNISREDAIVIARKIGNV